MTRSLNKVMLIGNVAKDPELKFTPSGIPVTSFRLATTESWRDKDGSLQEHTDWHSIVAWRGLAEIITKLVKRGSKIYVEGRLQSRSFEDKNGIKKYVVEVLADNMLILETKRTKDSEANTGESNLDRDESTDFDSEFEKRISNSLNNS